MPYPHRIVEDKPTSVVIQLTAWDNGKTYQLELPSDCYYRWMDGQVIQAAFPDMNVETRELLISGTSPEDLHGIFREPRS